MNLREAVIVRALQSSEVTALAANRLHWVMRPQAEALPALVFQLISGDRPEDLDGEPSMRTTRVQASAFALDKKSGGGGREQATALAEAAIAALLPEAEVDDLVFWRASATEPSDAGAQTDTGFVHQVDADLIIRWQQI